MSFSFKATLLLLACFCLINAMDHHHGATCNHDQHQKENPAGFVDIKEDFSSLESGRILASTDYPNIRIHANYDYLQKTAPTSYYNYIKNVLAPAVISYYQSALKIKYPVDGKLVLTSSVKTLCSLNTPSELYSGVDADYAILFNSRSESSSILATSYNCQLASGSKRPLIASTNFNRAMLTEPEAGDVLTHEKNTYLLLHEMMHTFGFSSSLYKYFVDASGKTLSGHIKSVSINGNSHTVVDVPALTDKLRNFHGCSSLPGAIMGIGDDSHWDKKLYLYETMQSGTIDGKRISEFGLGLLEASGWYVVDYDYAEPYFYGQGQGCDFINGACSSSKVAFDEFCIASGRGCNYMGNTGASCGSGSNMENCKYYIPSRDHHCEASENLGNARLSSVESYGRDIGSKCFTGTLYTKSSSSVYAYCLKYNCVGDGMNTQLQLILGSKTATCTKEGTVTVAGYYGYINCPDPLTFCNTVGKKYCPRNCMGRGTCVNNQCQCDSGFTGIDCALVA